MLNNTSIQHIFFDLDHTLWDFETNSIDALHQIHAEFNLQMLGFSMEEFWPVYKRCNDYCWEMYRKNQMNKDLLRHQRFYLALKDFGIQDRQLAKKMGKRYVAISPFKTALMPGTIDVLDYLHSKYPMHIITNGFEEVQYLKMSNTGIDKYFKKIITSEKVGRRKPEPKIFHFALKKAKCDAQHAIMIGDDLNTDVNGAIDAGLHAIWFNHHQKEHGPLKHPVIHHLSQLRDLL